MANLKLSYENQIQKNLVIATQNGNTKNKENSRKKNWMMGKKLSKINEYAKFACQILYLK